MVTEIFDPTHFSELDKKTVLVVEIPVETDFQQVEGYPQDEYSPLYFDFEGKERFYTVSIMADRALLEVCCLQHRNVINSIEPRDEAELFGHLMVFLEDYHAKTKVKQAEEDESSS
ncbi:MAG TPA: hypothetical protein VGE13_03625 [Candidatus Saccharimonadales bacterium]